MLASKGIRNSFKVFFFVVATVMIRALFSR